MGPVHCHLSQMRCLLLWEDSHLTGRHHLSPVAVMLQKEYEAQNDGSNFPFDLSKSPGISGWVSSPERRDHIYLSELLQKLSHRWWMFKQWTLLVSALSPSLPPSLCETRRKVCICVRGWVSMKSCAMLLYWICTQLPPSLQPFQLSSLMSKNMQLQAGMCKSSLRNGLCCDGP